MQQISLFADRLVNKAAFEYTIIALILLNGVFLGLGTSPVLAQQYGDLLHLGNQIVLGVFIVEALLKMIALAPRVDMYFRDGWNVFDFLVIVFSLIPATGEFAMVARLARLLRVLRLISAIRELRLIVAALVRSIPSVGHVMLLMSIIVYIYAIIGYQLFHEHDPMHWRSLGMAGRLGLIGADSVQHHHARRLDGRHGQRDAAAFVGVGVFRQLCRGRNFRRNKSVHCHHHQQSGRSEG